MIVFFSLLNREKAKHPETPQSVISHSYNSNLETIIIHEISNHGIDVIWFKKFGTKLTYDDYYSSRELGLNKLLCSHYTSHQVEFHSNNPIIGLIFPQKIPQQGNDDDFLSIA